MAAKAIGNPITSTASDAWDIVKGEAAGAASLALAKAAIELETYAAKTVAKGASGLTKSAASSELGRGILHDLGLGGVSTTVVVVGVVLLIILVIK